MRIIDRKFLANKSRYFFQCALAMVCMLVVLSVLDMVTDAVIVASLGASSFIVFSFPHDPVSRPRLLVGGYLIGCGMGTLCYWLMQWAPLSDLPVNCTAVYGALSIALTMLLMAMTNTEHPPSAGVALGLVVQQWSWLVVLTAVLGIIFLVVVRAVLRPILIRLA